MEDFNKILDKAKELENKIKESQEKIRKIEVEGISGSNSVKVSLNGDGDIIKNHVSSSGNAFPLGYNHYSKTQFNGNKQLIVNSLNYILGNDKLINIRSKEINLRLLNKSEIKKNRLKWQLFNTIIPIATIIVLIITLKISRKRKFI